MVRSQLDFDTSPLLVSLIMKPWVLISLLFSVCASAAPITALYLTGSAKSYVVGVQTITITPSDGFTFTPTMGTNFYGVTGPNYVEMAVTNFANFPNYQFWYLDLAVPEGQLLAPGLYSNATRFPFEAADEPGLSLYGDGRGDNRSTGYFDILEIAYSGNQLISLAADFVQYDEFNPQSISSGSIRFDSDIPINHTPGVPEPTTAILFPCGLAGVVLVCLSKRNCAIPSPQRAQTSVGT